MNPFYEEQHSEECLERLLEEYDQKIGELSDSDPYGLLEAYVNRGSILALMESNISALYDFEEAGDIIEEMETSGYKVDAGTYVKTYVNIGRMGDEDVMIESYDKAASRLNDLNKDSRHYDSERIVETCIQCTADLMAADIGDKSIPFIKKALSVLAFVENTRSKNRLAECYNLLGQIKQFTDREESIEYFEKALEVSEELLKNDELEDKFETVLSYVSLGDIYEEAEVFSQSIFYNKKAAELLETMYSEGSLEDIGLLIGLHQGLSSMLFSAGSEKEGEKHLLRAAKLGVNSL